MNTQYHNTRNKLMAVREFLPFMSNYSKRLIVSENGNYKQK
jgi:hypothetical protein